MNIAKSKIIIRQAGINDLDFLIEYRLRFLNEVPGQEHTVKDELFLRNSLREYFITALADKSYVAFIAEYENTPVSFGGLVIRSQPGNYTLPMGKTGYILSMYTLPEYRNNGIGGLIFKRLIEYGKQINLDRLELHATKDGEPIYRNNGFMPPHDVWLELNLN